MKKIRWGIVGPGNIAHRFAQAVKNLDCAKLVAVASRESERAEAFAQEYDIPNVFCGYEEMAKCDEVDAVYVATLHHSHMPSAKLFLNAGKHVLCEKPLCINAREAEILKKNAEENGVFLMEALWTRFLPAIIEAQKIVKNGEIGEILGIEADFCYYSTPENAPRAHLPELSGGSLLDVGIYGLNFAAIFLGSSPEKIAALANTNGGVDTHTNILLKYENGALANITSAVGVSKPTSACIYGTKGRISVPNFHGATELHISNNKGESTILKKHMGNGFEEQIIEACACIQNGKMQSDVMPLDESIKILKQMDEIRAQVGVKYPFED